jgi:hypothetical protein
MIVFLLSIRISNVVWGANKTNLTFDPLYPVTGVYVPATLANTTGPKGWYEKIQSATDSRWSFKKVPNPNPNVSSAVLFASAEYEVPNPPGVPAITTTVKGLNPKRRYKIRIIYFGKGEVGARKDPYPSWISAVLIDKSLVKASPAQIEKKMKIFGYRPANDDYPDPKRPYRQSWYLGNMWCQATLGIVEGVKEFSVVVDSPSDDAPGHIAQDTRYGGVSYEDLGLIPNPGSKW